MSDTAVAFAPGRVNLIGEHTDYYGGLALPFAIDLGVTVTATPLGGDAIEVVASDLGETDRFPAGGPPRAGGWRAYVRGTVAELAAAGISVPPARIEIASTLPRGAGLSSSAALTVALALALAALAGRGAAAGPGLDHLALARTCSRVENEWAGARTGLLDQLASLHASPGHAVRIDFRALSVDPVPLRLGGWTLVTVDSGERHAHAAGGYNERRAECAAACAALGVATLRDADPAAVAELPEPLRRRARHVLAENARVEAAVEALRAGDLAAVAPLLDASHASLRDLYDASTPAVERTVAALREAGAAGARMVGGGFGGHVLGLLPPGIPPPPGALPVAPAAGARVTRA